MSNNRSTKQSKKAQYKVYSPDPWLHEYFTYLVHAAGKWYADNHMFELQALDLNTPILLSRQISLKGQSVLKPQALTHPLKQNKKKLVARNFLSAAIVPNGIVSFHYRIEIPMW